MLGASELNVSASGVAEGVFTFVLVPSHCGCSSAECLRRWAAVAWTSGSGAVGCNGAESGEGTD